MLDARANIYAEVGGTAVQVISGETSDDFLLMSGLISTTGRLSVAGLHPAGIGTLVKLAFVRGGFVGRLPRPRLRVLRCTVDPLRRVTEYELGDLFALKSGIRATDPLGLATPTSNTEATYDADALVRQAFSAALGSDPGPTGINGRVWGDFDWRGGYLSGAGEILLSFGRFAYLTPDETVAFASLADPPLSGAEVALDDLIDLRPLSGGPRPGAIAIGAGQVRTKGSDDGGGGGGASGSTTSRDAVLTIPAIVWSVGLSKDGDRWTVNRAYDQQDQEVSYQITSYTITTGSGSGSGTITTTDDLVGAIGVGYMSEIPSYVHNLHVADAQRRADALNQGIVSEEQGALPGPISGTQDTRSLPAATNTVLDAERPDTVVVVPNASPIQRVTRTREVSNEWRNESSSGSVRRSYITRYEAQLAIAQSRKAGQGNGQLELIYADLTCDFLAAETTTTTSRVGSLSVTRTTTWDFRSGTSTSVQWDRRNGGANTSEPGDSWTTTLYRARVAQQGSDYLDSESVYVCPCTIVDSPEAAYAQFGTVQNRLSYGYRHGVQLQSVIGGLPTTPGSMFHLTTEGQTGTFRVNGLSVAFDATQCLISMDALYWGASA